MRSAFIGVLVAVSAVAVVLHMTVDGGSQNIPSGLLRTPRAPADNPTTPAKVALGRLLFWDPILSGPQDVACATCHHPRFGYAENRDVSIGVTGIGLGRRRRLAHGSAIPLVKRNSPPVLNIAFSGSDESGDYNPGTAPMFWDMRIRSLESQALEPLKTLEEMRGHIYPEHQAVARVVKRLQANSEYRHLFTEAFGGEPAVTEENLSKALAAFQRSLLANNAPFDRYMRGDRNAMTRSQIRGMRRFDRIGCVKCHSGPMFSDYKLHVLGVPDNSALPSSDRGAEGRYAFRTASLRNLEFTAPYMHSGIFRTLEDVLDFYDDVDSRRGRDRNPNVSRDELDQLVLDLRGVDDDDEDLIAFLRALSDPSFDRTIPERVPSGLAVGGRIH